MEKAKLALFEDPEREIFTVSELNLEVQATLEENFRYVWVEGEISNLAQPSSGHLYFTMKDPEAQIRCALFKTRRFEIKSTIKDGMHVIALAKVSLYVPRGDYQLIIEHLEEAGDGVLQRKFEALKKKLFEEGLFDATHKKELPALPQCIGVITSPTGAAIRDILSVCEYRFPAIPIIVYPTSVQGDKAANEIVAAIELANQHALCDVLILARGGGSLEDLWPFNEEKVARAIFASTLPIVSGVGHEIDTTIADYVADQRAPTPSAAAELVCPSKKIWAQQVDHAQHKIQHAILKILQHKFQMLEWLQRALRNPKQTLQEKMQRVDELERQLLTGMQHFIQKHHQDLSGLSRTLHAISPLATLDRGYAIVSKAQTHQILRDSAEVSVGDHVSVRLKQGEFTSVIDKIT